VAKWVNADVNWRSAIGCPRAGVVEGKPAPVGKDRRRWRGDRGRFAVSGVGGKESVVTTAETKSTNLPGRIGHSVGGAGAAASANAEFTFLATILATREESSDSPEGGGGRHWASWERGKDVGITEGKTGCDGANKVVVLSIENELSATAEDKLMQHVLESLASLQVINAESVDGQT
jgi:hypothetical protein